MKVTARSKIVILICILIGTIFLCLFSKRFYEAANDRTIFEQCEEPITVLRLTRLALGDPRLRSAANACINNLRQLDAAKQQWALEYKKSTNDVVSWKDVTPYLSRGGGDRPWCPQGGVYRLGHLDEAPKCSVQGHKLPD